MSRGDSSNGSLTGEQPLVHSLRLVCLVTYDSAAVSQAARPLLGGLGKDEDIDMNINCPFFGNASAPAAHVVSATAPMLGVDFLPYEAPEITYVQPSGQRWSRYNKAPRGAVTSPRPPSGPPPASPVLAAAPGPAAPALAADFVRT